MRHAPPEPTALIKIITCDHDVITLLSSVSKGHMDMSSKFKEENAQTKSVDGHKKFVVHLRG